MGGCPGKIKNTEKQQHSTNQYNFLCVCGKGGFGKVWKVELKKTRQHYALKVMSKAKILAKKSVSSIMNQKNLLSIIQHNLIVNMIASFQDRQNLYLLMDLLNGGDLRFHINRKVSFNQYQIKFIIWCIIEALEYLHSMNIIHRDLKPQNIIFQENGYCRITDLGVARQYKQQNSTQTSGTPGYMAPQVMCRQNHSFPADYYAVGIMTYELFMKKRPYNGKNRKQIRDDILSRQAKMPNDYSGCSSQAIDFVNKMIQRKWRNRLGFNGIKQIKDHPWLRKNQIEQKLFLQMKLAATFLPNTQISNFSKNIKQSQPDDTQKQNMILLKKQQVQSMFQGYNHIKWNIMHNSQKYRDKSQPSTIQITGSTAARIQSQRNGSMSGI